MFTAQTRSLYIYIRYTFLPYADTRAHRCEHVTRAFDTIFKTLSALFRAANYVKKYFPYKIMANRGFRNHVSADKSNFNCANWIL